MFGLKRKLEKLESAFEEYKFNQANLPLYKVGQILRDGTVIANVEKQYCSLYHRLRGIIYIWRYDGITNGVLIKDITPELIEDSYESLNNALKEQCVTINTHEAIIHKLSYQVNNPPTYKVGQKVKEYGMCTNVELITEIRAHVRAEYHYDYTFIKNNKTMTVSE